MHRQVELVEDGAERCRVARPGRLHQAREAAMDAVVAGDADLFGPRMGVD